MLRYGGKVGTGFSDSDLTVLTARLAALEREENPFGAGPHPPRKARFVEPRLIAEIEFREMTNEGLLRHPAYKGLREDKPACEVVLEREVKLSDWYAQIAEVLLPHLRGRPLTLKRGPDAVKGKHERCSVEDAATLASLGEVELHASLSLAADMERPTAMVFDLDPGAPADMLDCAQVAVWLQGLFEQLGLRCYPKTSGSRGMQLYVPLNGSATYTQTKPFAKAVAETLERKFPDRVVSQIRKAKRAGKVLVDWSQNDARKTTICVYSLRGRESPTISTPLEWGEVEAALAAGAAEALAFDPAAVLERVAAKGDLFAPLLSEQQELPDL